MNPLICRTANTLISSTRREVRIAARMLKENMGYTIKQIEAELISEIHRQKQLCSKPKQAKPIKSFSSRIKVTLCKRSEKAIVERHLGVPAGWTSGSVYDRVGKIWLYGAEYRMHYSSKAGDWWVGAAYLCGVEHGQVWAVRVPKTFRTVQRALNYIIPAAIHSAIANRKDVRRQGDVWFVPSRRENLSALPPSHRLEVDGNVRFVIHPQHGRMELPDGNLTVYRNKSVEGSGAKVD